METRQQIVALYIKKSDKRKCNILLETGNNDKEREKWTYNPVTTL